MISPTEDNCTGCRTCEKICPTQSISMLENENGFYLPYVRQETCINCGLCDKKCPTNIKGLGQNIQSVYAAYTTLPQEVHSASGGIFLCLARVVIESGGVVFGAAYDDDLNLKITSVKSVEDLQMLQGSKYLQADTSESYLEVENCLKNGVFVLYSGTPCQIAGLKSFIDNKYTELLMTAEIICHGVPSPKMFKNYLEWREKIFCQHITGVEFRTKEVKHGRDFSMRFSFEHNKPLLVSGFKDPYYKRFMSANMLRKSCYQCPFANLDRVADITLGDFWNVEAVDPSFGKGKRVSTVMVNSELGVQAWENVQEYVVSMPVDYEIVVAGNPNLKEPSKMPSLYMGYGSIKNSDEFFEQAQSQSGNKKRELFNLLPLQLRRLLKRIIIKYK